MIKKSGFLLLFVGIVACSSPKLMVTNANQTMYPDGVYHRKVELMAEKQSYICFMELLNENISGINCQNNLGFSAFSAKLEPSKAPQFSFSNPTITKAEAKLVVDLLTLSVFTEYNLQTQQGLTVLNQHNKTEIINNNNQLLYRVSQ